MILRVRVPSPVPTWSGGHVNLSTIYIENRRYSITGRGCWLLTAAKWSTTLQHDVLVHVSHSQDVRRYTIGLHHAPLAQKAEHVTCWYSVKVTPRCRSVWSGEAGAVPATDTINHGVRGSNPRWRTRFL